VPALPGFGGFGLRLDTVLPFLAFLHGRFGFALLIFAAVLGLLGTGQLLTRRAVGGGFRAGYLLVWGLTIVQGLAGAGGLIGGARPREPTRHCSSR